MQLHTCPHNTVNAVKWGVNRGTEYIGLGMILMTNMSKFLKRMSGRRTRIQILRRDMLGKWWKCGLHKWVSWLSAAQEYPVPRACKHNRIKIRSACFTVRADNEAVAVHLPVLIFHSFISGRSGLRWRRQCYHVACCSWWPCRVLWANGANRSQMPKKDYLQSPKIGCVS